MITMGIRFKRGDARSLRSRGDWVANNDIPNTDPGIFYLAADSAHEGVPFVVKCEQAAEAHEMAALFVTTCGISPPSVTTLSGS